MSKSGARVTTRQRSIGVAASAAFHIAILIGLVFELDKPIAVESPPMQVTLAPPLAEPPPIPIPIIPPKPKPTPVEKAAAATPTPAAPAKPLQAPVQPAAAAAPAPLTSPAPKPAPTVRVKAPTPVAHAAQAPAPTPIAHTSPSLIQAPMAPVLLPPSPQAAASAAAAVAPGASAAPGAAAAGSNGLRDALRLGFGCAHPDAVNLTPAEREACRRTAARGGPAFTVQPPAYIQHEGEVNEAWRRYQTSNSSHDYPGLHCAAGRDCEPDRPTPSPDPIADTCPYMRCNMGSVR
jgi:hypothetical protein